MTTANTATRRMLDCSDELATVVLDAAFDVHRELGPGLLESIYEAALAIALADRGLIVARQVDIAAFFQGHNLGIGFRADIVVDGCLLLELKAVDQLQPVHTAQIMTYLKLMKIRRGYLLNFNVKLLKEGIKRVSL
ncbi:MAG: GxxExxY protein [Burkholderiaceae bacterium]|nr:GxxExxY protein [Sulfuritalea sp.]MCF8176543.1 GxxExxY protein [Burkholderiaceae bacterium]